jgi:hypothetical protein
MNGFFRGIGVIACIVFGLSTFIGLVIVFPAILWHTSQWDENSLWANQSLHELARMFFWTWIISGVLSLLNLIPEKRS